MAAVKQLDGLIDAMLASRKAQGIKPEDLDLISFCIRAMEDVRTPVTAPIPRPLLPAFLTPTMHPTELLGFNCSCHRRPQCFLTPRGESLACPLVSIPLPSSSSSSPSLALNVDGCIVEPSPYCGMHGPKPPGSYAHDRPTDQERAAHHDVCRL